MTDYSPYNDATLNHVLEGHKKELLLAKQEINSINEELLKRHVKQQAKLRFSELAACIRHPSNQSTLASVLLMCLPTILAALDLAASGEPQRTE